MLTPQLGHKGSVARDHADSGRETLQQPTIYNVSTGDTKRKWFGNEHTQIRSKNPAKLLRVRTHWP